MPLKRPYGTARGVTKAATNFLITVVGTAKDSSFTGVGECQPRHALTGDGDRRGQAAWGFLTAAAKQLHSKTLPVENREQAIAGIRKLMANLDDLAREHADDSNRDRPFRGTLLGIEVALLDVASQALGLQMSELLGKRRDDIAISISTISSSTQLQDVAEKVIKQTRFPMTRVKGVGDLEYNWSLLETVFNANRSVQRDKPIWMDINEALDFSAASTFIQGIVDRMEAGTLPGSIVLEGILPKADVTDLPRLQRQADDACRSVAGRDDLDIRIMPDEGMWDVTDLERVNAHGGCRALNIKAPKAGGLLASLDLAEAAVAADPDIHVCIGGMLGTSDITAWALHNLARALPRVDYLTTVPPTNVEQRIAEPRARYRERGSNVIARQKSVGLGTRVALDAVRPYFEQSFATAPDLESTVGAAAASTPRATTASLAAQSNSLNIPGAFLTKTLVFAGDTSLGDAHINKKGGELLERLTDQPMSFFDEVAPLVSNHDAFILNLETVLADSPSSPFEGKKRFLGWDSPDRAVKVLKELGVEAVNLANNHTMDFGPDTLLSTKSTLEKAGIRTIGAGSTREEAAIPLRMSLAFGGTARNVYVVGACEIQRTLRDEYGFYATSSAPGVYAMDVDEVVSTVRELSHVDPGALIIVYPHWGQNYQWVRPSARRASERLAEAGAHLIIGHGAHVLQELDIAGPHATVYSVGNFVFNWSGRFDKFDVPPYSLVARVDVGLENDQWRLGLRLYPIVSDNRQTGFQPRPVREDEFESLWSALLNRDGSLAQHARPARDTRGHHIACTVTPANRTAPEIQPPRQESGTVAPTARASRSLPHGVDAFSAGSTSRLLAEAVTARGFPYEVLSVPGPGGNERTAMRFSVKDHNYFIRTATIVKEGPDGLPGTTIDGRAVQVCKRKDVTSAIMSAHGFSVPRGMSFAGTDLRAALHYFDAVVGASPHGVCVKPANGNKGQHIYVNLDDRASFRAAFEAVTGDYETVLVEESVSGEVLRFLYIGGEVVAIRRGMPANVVGDGVATISDLVEGKNAELRRRGADRHSRLRLGTDERAFLERHGMTPQTIPEADQRVFLSSLSNRHAAADIIDCTDEVHASYVEVVERATGLIPDINVCGVDVMVKDFTVPAEPQNHFFIEFNTTPGIRGHHNPTVGKPRDVASMIIDHVARTLP
jgi:D-alanine-D-alanine ligase-like ATP-grasp enzyme/L-alanine-DL-glutamate epimerase-like enolase superfamily enzyme